MPFNGRDTDRYRFRVPTEFTDLPTLPQRPAQSVAAAAAAMKEANRRSLSDGIQSQ